MISGGTRGIRPGSVDVPRVGARPPASGPGRVLVRVETSREGSHSDADQSASGADQDASDADQNASDRDQSASDRDRRASDRDAADAASDQLAADRDQAHADKDHLDGADGAATEAGHVSRLAREASAISRLATQVARVETGAARDATADERDLIAAARDATADERDLIAAARDAIADECDLIAAAHDETARRRDAQAQAMERAIAASEVPPAEKFEQIRIRAAADRSLAAADRRRAALDRAYAASERARLETDLRSAHRDDLTGAFRREVGWRALAVEIARAQQGDGRFVVAFVDVDGLKRINDGEGHAAGDEVLRKLAIAMRSHLRWDDPIVRYGGDEFVCGLGGADLADVERRFRSIDRSLRDEVGVGISVGLAALTEEETLDQLTARADAALLAAKKGRS